MPFTLPNFNLLYDHWPAGTTPDTDPPDSTDNPCQVYVHSRADIDQTPGDNTAWQLPIYLRIPLRTVAMGVGDIVQVSYLPFDYYLVRWVQNIHMNFPNEYIVVLVEQCTSAGVTPR